MYAREEEESWLARPIEDLLDECEKRRYTEAVEAAKAVEEGERDDDDDGTKKQETEPLTEGGKRIDCVKASKRDVVSKYALAGYRFIESRIRQSRGRALDQGVG